MLPECKILVGDCLDVLKTLPDQSVHCCVTSPPYWGLRDYGHDGQIGLEKSPEAYVAKMVEVFRKVRRVLTNDGTLWLNLGDSYSGSGKGGNPDDGKQATNRGSQTIGVLYGKTAQSARDAALTNVSCRWTSDGGIAAKQLIGIPWRVAFALQADGWWLRQDIIWHKPNPMPESVTDRCTKSHEYLFLLSKSAKYYYDQQAIAEPLDTEPHIPGNNHAVERSLGPNDRNGHSQWDDTKERVWCKSGFRNKRSVWTVATSPYPEAHFATYPPDLIKPCILAGCPAGGTVLDPFGGSGTTDQVSLELGRNAILIELNPAYAELATRRCRVTPGLPL